MYLLRNIRNGQKKKGRVTKPRDHQPRKTNTSIMEDIHLSLPDEVRYHPGGNAENQDTYGWTKRPQTQSTGTEGRLQAIVNKQGQIELDLSNRNLRTVPREVYNQLRTEALKLHSNELRGISSGISKLHKLRVLDLHENYITILPDTLVNLLHLTELDLSHNKMGMVPTMLGSFKYLRILRMGDNHLESLPHELGDLSALRQFDAAGNKLWHLPYSFQNLQHLQQLNLARNRFDQCPISLCQMRSLQTLDLHGNKLSNLPTDLDRLKVLQELNVASNDFETIPQCIFNMKSLTSLDMSHNKLRSVPSRICRLPKLRILMLEDNNLTSMPPNLEVVEYLNVAHNNMKNFTVVKMKRLVYLNAAHNQLENLPLGIYNLSHLKVLKLNSNKISYISQDIILLKKLRTLDVGNNRLTSLPQVINELERLEIFNVKGNKIAARYPYHHHNPLYHPVPMIPVGLMRVKPRQQQQPVVQNGHVRAPPVVETVQQETTQEAEPQGPIPNGKVHTGSPQHLYVQNKVGSPPDGGTQPGTRWNRLSRFRKSLGFRKTKTKTGADEQLNGKPRSASSHVRERLPLDYHKQSQVPPQSQSTILYPPKLPPDDGFDAIEEEHPQYRSLPRSISAIHNAEPLQAEIVMTSHPRTTTEISYPFDSTGYLADLDQHPVEEIPKRAYTDEWLTSRQDPLGSIKSTAVTVNDSVGDRLSLGDDDYEYQPTTVTDYRLLGVCSEVETMLNQQLLQPIISHKGIFKKSMPNISDFNDLSNIVTPSHHATYGGGTFEPESDEANKAPPGGIYRAKPDVFRVTQTGGLFRSSVDSNISVYFPRNCLDAPLTVTMQIEKISPETLADARRYLPDLGNLLSVGHIVYITQNKDAEFNAQVTVTIPAPPVEHIGRLHLVTYLEDDVCVPCTAEYRQQNGYISLQAWHFSGKGAVLTKSKSRYKACKSMEAFLQHLYI